MAQLTRVEGPGKFEGELLITVFAWICSQDTSFLSEWHSDESTGEWVGKIDGPVLSGDGVAAEVYVTTGQYLSLYDIAFLVGAEGVILSEDAFGFVCGTWYTDPREYARDWEREEENAAAF